MHQPTSGRVTPTATRPVPIGELLDAWLALQRGDFRRGAPRLGSGDTTGSSWSPAPGEVPILVIGCGGGAGASTLALLLAEASTKGRVVECTPTAGSGLAGASTAELGATGHGWTQGRRGDALIQRRRDDPTGPAPAAVPVPMPGSPGGTTAVDAGSNLRSLLTGKGWLTDFTRTCPRVVLVARCTVPGVSRLEANLTSLETDRCWAVLTHAPQQLPRPVDHALGTRTRELRRLGRLHLLPREARLELAGITTEPLPRTFYRATRTLLKGLLP